MQASSYQGFRDAWPNLSQKSSSQQPQLPAPHVQRAPPRLFPKALLSPQSTEDWVFIALLVLCFVLALWAIMATIEANKYARYQAKLMQVLLNNLASSLQNQQSALVAALQRTLSK